MSEPYTIFSSENNNLDQATAVYESLGVDCPYNYPPYLDLIAQYLYDDLKLNIFCMETGNGIVFYPFFKRPLNNISQIPGEYHGYFDIISSWYFGGPLVSENADIKPLMAGFNDAFSQFCSDEKIIAEFVRFDPNIKNHQAFEGQYEITHNRETVPVDLTLAYEDIWAGYKGRCRTSIRKAAKSGITVSGEESIERVDAFFDIYQAEMERKADSKHYFFSIQFFRDMIEKLPEHFKYFFAYHEETLCGCTIVYCKDGTAYDYLMATRMDYWKYQPNNILLDHAIKWSKEQGYKIFDLMGGRDGVFNFKSSFSKLREDFFTGKKIHQRDVYAILDQESKTILKDKYNPGFFPTYRQLENIGLV